jgi:PAS domain S-box-containing protein
MTENKATDDLLRDELEKGRLIRQIALNTRGYFNLSEIFQASLPLIRQFLQGDRLLIYQLLSADQGKIVGESVTDQYPSFLGEVLNNTVFLSVDHQSNNQSSNQFLLASWQVKANLVIPIIVNLNAASQIDITSKSNDQKPWGLFIIQQCSQPRTWQPAEVNLLEELAIHLAIAIQQTELYQQVQQKETICTIHHQPDPQSRLIREIAQKVRLQTELQQRKKIELALEELNQVLEQKVAERTQELSLANAQLRAEIAERQVTQDILGRQAQKSRLFTEISLKIRQSLNLGQILQTAVKEIQQILNSDRVLIYKILPDGSGKVLREASKPEFSSLLYEEFAIEVLDRQCQAKYLDGQVRAINDVRKKYYKNTPCLLDFLAQWDIQAKLVVPIIDSDRLWGLIVAHQCSHTRIWTEFEIELMGQIANQLSLAIAQSELLSGIQEKQQFIESIANSTPNIMYIFDLVEHKNIYCNNAIFDILGYTPAEIQALGGDMISQIIHPEDQASYIEQLNIFYTDCHNHAKYKREYRTKDKQGNIHWMNSYATVFRRNSQGEPTQIIGTTIDITAQKLAELEKQQIIRELEFQKMALDEVALVTITNAQGVIKYVNEQFCKISQYTPEELIGHTHAPVKSGYHPAEFFTDMWQTIRQGKIWKGELKNRRKDGTTHWLDTTIVPFLDAQGQPFQYLAIRIDIDQRKRTEENLIKVNTLQQALLDGSDYGIISTNVDGIIQSFNVGAEKLLGYKAEEVIGQMTPVDFHYEQDVENLAKYLSVELKRPVPASFPALVAQALDSGKNTVSETVLQRKDGTEFPATVAVSILRNQIGEVTGFLGVVQDITANKETLEKLHRQLAAVEASVDGITVLQKPKFKKNNRFNADNQKIDHDYYYIYVNQAHLKMFGYNDQTEILGKSWRELYEPEQIIYIEKEVLPQLYRDKYWQGASLAKRQDGSTFYQELSLTLTADGDVVRLCRDITARREAEIQLRRTNEELAKASQLKSEFLANMSHELRTPLNSIMGLSQVLQEQVFGELNPKQKQSVQTIYNSGEHLLSLINEILELAKIESGKLELNIESVAIINVCQNSLSMVKTQASKKKLQLILDVPNNLGDIQADERRLRQVLINLLSNAVKFTPDNGQVTLQVQPQYEEKQLIFQVIDTGIGISPEDQGKLFQAFVQIDSKLSRRYEGTGLGLVLVKQIVELHGGNVAVTSQVGAGSCFTLYLPWQPNVANTIIATPSADISTPMIMPEHTQHKPLILLAEDNATNVETIVEYLEMKGYELILAVNGLEAVKLAHDRQPQLILMDIQMPEMDGIEATIRIRQDVTACHIPIIALTALTMPEDREKCLQAGINDYVSKPFRLKDLVEKIEHNINQNINHNINH